ncbi:MAG: hypothetical protein HY917_00040, partial [Candidatus Diapherotrites archaeon]|nr:hypothetical protein [Candidatus Diapherotrites archaeon]
MKYAILLGVLFLISTVQAVSISMEPAEENPLSQIPVLQATPFIVRATHEGPQTLTNFYLRIETDPGLKIIEDQKEIQSINLSPITLAPHNFFQRTILLYPSQNEAKEYTATITYGEGEFTHQTRFTIHSLATALQLTPTLKSFSALPETESLLLLDLENTSKTPLTHLRVEILPGPFFAPKGRPFELDSLDPGQKITGKAMYAETLQEVVTPQPITIQATFQENGKTKTLQYRVITEPPKQDNLFTGLAVIVLA